MAKNLYVDTDNNRLIAGPLTTQLAVRQVFYAGNTETVTVDLIERDSNSTLLNLVPATGTTVALLVGTPTTVISVPSLSRVTDTGVTATAVASLYTTATATGTVSLYSGVTATGTAQLFGNTTALATATVTRGTACTLSLTVASVRTPKVSLGIVSAELGDTPATASATTASTRNPFTFFKSTACLGTAYVEIEDAGQNMLGSPQVYYVSGSNNSNQANVTANFTFSGGSLVSINPSFVSENANLASSQIRFVPDPDFLASAETVTVASAGTGFPDGVDIPFFIPSDETGDGRPCTGFLRAVNGSVVSVVSISSRGSRFTSSTTTGKNHGTLPYYRLASVSVTCAGAGYWDAAPAVAVDSTYLETTAGGSAAQLTAVTVPGGGVSVLLSSAGYGYAATPGIRIAAPRISDGVRLVTLTNTPAGYAPGSYACTVSGPATGVTAAINLVVTSGGAAFAVANPGAGYTSAPTVAAPAPNLTGSVASVTIVSGGLGYTTVPTVTFTGNGSGAAGTAVLSAGQVAGVTVTTWGSGYSGTVTVTIAPPANQGKVESVTVLNAGTNYSSAPTVTFSGGGGTGAAATAVVLAGGVSSVFVTNRGSGYSSAPAVAIAAGDARTVFSGVLTVTTVFVNSILPSTSVTLQVNLVTTTGTSTVLQTAAGIAASL